MKPPPPAALPAWQERLLRLNLRQLRALVFGVFMCVFMGLMPPWERTFMNPLGEWYDRPAGYHWILSPPDIYNVPEYLGATVQWKMLFAQWFVAAGITLAFLIGLRDKPQFVEPRVDPFR